MERWIYAAVGMRRSVDELVALARKHLDGEATDEDILKFFLEGEKSAPRRRASIIGALARLRSALGRLHRR